MSRDLSADQKRDVESGFILRQQLAAGRRRFMHRVFLTGASSGLLNGVLLGFELRFWFVGLMGLIYIFALFIYVGAAVVPLSFQKDTDVRWHLNPWRDALVNLKEGQCQREAIILLAGPLLVRMNTNFAYWSFK